MTDDGAAEVDPATPPILLYVKDEHGRLRLAGAEWFAADPDQDLATEDGRPTLFGQPFDGPMPGHAPGMPIHFDLHVWQDNPTGMFKAWNPTVTCGHSTMVPKPPANHHEPIRIGKDTYLIRPMFGEGEGPVAVYVNSLVITGPEPVIVDTGTVVNRQQWLADVFSLVDPEDIRYVFLSHDDHDHAGNLVPLLEAAPQETLLTTWFTQERLAGDLSIPLERVRWLNDGDTLDAGDRTLALVRPPLYDAPTTRGLFDPASDVYWAVDTYGVALPSPVTDVGDLPPRFWDERFLGFNRMNSPWHEIVDPALFNRQVDRVERLGPTVLASAHGPIISGANVAEAHRKIRQAAGGPTQPLPTQTDLDAMLAAHLHEPAPLARQNSRRPFFTMAD